MRGDFITNQSRISVRMILTALRSSNFSITTFTNLAQSLTSTRTLNETPLAYVYTHRLGVVNLLLRNFSIVRLYYIVRFALAALLSKRARAGDVRGPVIIFLVVLLRANYETTGVSSKKTGGTSINIISGWQVSKMIVTRHCLLCSGSK